MLGVQLARFCILHIVGIYHFCPMLYVFLYIDASKNIGNSRSRLDVGGTLRFNCQFDSVIL